jgi:hypothetical protein
MSWLLLLLVLATDPPTSGEEVGAKAMFGDPSLNILHFSPRQDEGKPIRKVLPVAPEKKDTRKLAPRTLPAPPSALVRPPQDPAPSPVPESEPVRSIGIRFWVQRVDDQGKVLGEMEVGRLFRSGERIQLVVESNADGYLAVVQQGSDGRAGLLFPAHESELEAARIQAHTKVLLPGARHSFIFDQQAGTEHLLIVVARDRQELAALPLRREMGPADLTVVRRIAARELGAKNLVIEAFADPEEDPATYAVNRAGSAIVQEIALVHEK